MTPEIDTFVRIFIFVFGAMIGSFLNVCIVRLPRSESIVFPSSHCPKCQVPIAWYDNIPLLSFFVLMGKCRQCHQPIPGHYVVVEFLTGCLFLLTYLVFGWSWVLVPSLVLVCGLMVATWVDIQWRIIPDEVSVWGIPVGLFLSAVIPGLHKGPDIQVLWTGAAVSCFLVTACYLLHVFKLYRYKLPFEKDDSILFGISILLVAIQFLAIVLALKVPAFTVTLSALADACQGILIGAGALWVTGLIGEIIINKRIVTEFDFKGMVLNPSLLIAHLTQHGYIDAQGNLQSKFRDLKSVDDLILKAEFDSKRQDIFDMIRAVDEGGVMGWGDVKLLAMSGAFLGWQLAGVAFFVAPFFGSVVGLIKMLRRQDTAIAYGPFLALGTLASLFVGDKLLQWLVHLYTIG